MSLICQPAMIPTIKNRTIKHPEKNSEVASIVLSPCDFVYCKSPHENSILKKNCLLWKAKSLLNLKPCFFGSSFTLLSISSTPLFICSLFAFPVLGSSLSSWFPFILIQFGVVQKFGNVVFYFSCFWFPNMFVCFD